MRSKPAFSYVGLTVVLSNPSRFDIKCRDLLSANGGRFFEDAIRPEFNRGQCDIRIKEDKSPLLDNTKCILLLGEDAMHSWLPQLQGNTIGQCRGSVYMFGDIPCIPSFFPQDCVDMKDYESQYNDYSSNDGNDSAEGEEDAKSRKGHTQRKNYGFWLWQDIQRKVKYLLKNGGIPPKSSYISTYKIRPNSAEIIHELSNTKGQHLYLDIETDLQRNILCIAYSFGNGNISVVPFIDHNYKQAYHNLHVIYRALAIALRDNIAVAHNGYGFDFLILAIKYKLAIGKESYDTLIAQHRIFPDAEKSLGHCTSLWTWEPYHKDEAEWGYRTPEQCTSLWRYCGKDVHTMILIHKAQQEYARKIPGLLQSINAGNRAIKPYITTMLQGIRYSQDKVVEVMRENDRLMMQYIRIIKILIGEKTVNHLRLKSKMAMPGSNAQCVDYFHNLLGYEVVGYGKERKDGTRGASLGKENIFKLKLKLKQPNPVLDFVIAYREVQTESGYLKFLPWRGDNEYFVDESNICLTSQK